MLVFVINLDRAPDRLAHMRAEFTRVGVPFTRLAATDGRELGSAGHINALEGRRLSSGEIACFMSHRRCWQQLVDSEKSHAAIFEDDVFLGEDAGRFLTSADWFPDGVGIVKLETYMSRTTIAANPAASVDGRHVHKLLGKHLGASGYAIDRDTARLLLDLSETIDRQVDDFVFDPQGPVFARANVHQMTPALCIQGLKLAGRRSRGVKEATYASDLYAERLTTRRRLGPAGKAKREIVSGLSRLWEGLVGRVGNFSGRARWGRVPFR